jgi:hypothetical protein
MGGYREAMIRQACFQWTERVAMLGPGRAGCIKVHTNSGKVGHITCSHTL